MVNLSELHTLTRTTCLSLRVSARTTGAHDWAVFILTLLPVGGNLLLPVSQPRSWVVSREGHLPGGRGEPGAGLGPCRLLRFALLAVRERKGL